MMKDRLLEVEAFEISITDDPEVKSSSRDWAPPSLPVIPVVTFKIGEGVFTIKIAASQNLCLTSFLRGAFLPSFQLT